MIDVFFDGISIGPAGPWRENQEDGMVVGLPGGDG